MKKPITDPKEIAALEDGYIGLVHDPEVDRLVPAQKMDDGEWWEVNGAEWSYADILNRGGITDRLVPQSELDAVKEKLQDAMELLWETTENPDAIEAVQAFLKANAKDADGETTRASAHPVITTETCQEGGKPSAHNAKEGS